jgi:hypothetical protein
MRELLIEVGLDLLIEEGLALGTERLTFKRVFERAAVERGVRVTNASVIGRIWADMADYQADVLAAALSNDDIDGLEGTIRAAAQALAVADLTTVEGRRAATAEVIRVGCAAHIDSVTRVRKASINMGLRGLSISRLPTDVGTPTSVSVRRAYEEFAVRWDFVFAQAFEVIGIRLRPGLTIRQLSMLAISLTEGFAIWDRVEPTMTRYILRPTGPDGEKQEWTLFSLGVEALVWQFTELIDAPVADGPRPSDGSETGGSRRATPDHR